MLNEKLGFFAISVDKLVAVFQGAYPELEIRLNWDREQVTQNIAPFLGHFLGAFSSADGRGLLSYSHGGAGHNRFVLEGGYFDFEKILPVLQTYGVKKLREKFILIGLVQNKKTPGAFVRDFKKYDTEKDWTVGFSEKELMKISEDLLCHSRFLSEHLKKYGFTIYDTSQRRVEIFDQIITDIKGAADFS